MSAARVRLGNAPVSYGVFGDLDLAGVTTPAGTLATMAQAGYAGSELGPPGFFGGPEEAASAFAATGLTGIGTYVPLHTQDEGESLARDLDRMRQSIREVAAVNPGGLIVLADEGDATLLANPCHRPELGLDEAGWQRLASVVQSAADEARAAGLTATFHPHLTTYVESPAEIEQLLARTDLALTFDVAHVVMGGGDAVADLERWWERINHLHIKDVRLAVLRQAVESGRSDVDVWWGALCTPLGEGDLDLVGFLAAVRAHDYDGWLVVEQDSAPVTANTLAQVNADQQHNLDWLRRHLAP